jgi:hypothetical protein
MSYRLALAEIAATILTGAVIGGLIVAAVRIDTPARAWAREAVEMVRLNLPDR